MNKTWFTLMFFAQSLLIFAQSEKEYAKYLFETKDYFRAISAYKELLFYTDNIENKKLFLLQIAKAYYLSDRFQLSVSYNSKLSQITDENDNFVPSSNILFGLNYYKLKNFTLAQKYFDKAIENDPSGHAAFYKNLLEIENGNYTQAAAEFTNLADNYEGAEVGSISQKLLSELLNVNELPSKSPVLASLLSAVVPGLGQVYTHHYYDGLQSFLYFALTSFSAYACYRYDKNFNDNFITTYIATTVAALFYGANILGAYQTADFYNYKQRTDFNDKIIGMMFSIDFNF